MINIIQNSGLKKTKEDPRDFSHKKTFGSISQPLPDEYIIGSCPVKNQMQTEFCTAFASYVLAALEDGKDFSPEWFFAKEVEISGETDGQDLRTACKTAVQYGFLLQDLALNTTLNQSAQFLADPKNWSFSDDLAAVVYKKKSYFRVDGNFQEIKQTLYQNIGEKRAIITGIDWYNEFTYAPNGIIPSPYKELGGGHCIPIIGFKKINDVDYIIIQNSYGDQIGDKGLYYFNEEVFNREFNQPMYMFVDIDNTNIVPQPIGNKLQILIKNICQLVHL